MSSHLAPYYALARRLGLTATPREAGLIASAITLRGALDGQTVVAQRSMLRAPWIHVWAPLTPSLDLGLRFGASGLLDGLKQALGAGDVKVDHAAIDKGFTIGADEPERARALLAGPVAEAIAARLPLLLLSIDDDGVQATHGDNVADECASLEKVMRDVAGIATAIERARGGVPPAAPLAPLSEAWTAFATARGFSIEAGAPMRMHGAIGTARVVVATKRVSKGAYEIAVAVELDRPLDFELRVGPARSGLSTWVDAEDIELDHPAFDARFDVRTDDAARAKHILDEHVRTLLLEIPEGARVHVDPRGVSVHDDAHRFSPETVPVTVDLLAAIAEDITTKARESTGAYR